MSLKAMAALVAVGSGGSLNVAAECRREGVSRKTFYKWAARYRDEGLAGLEDRPRRPRSSPRRTPPEVEDAVARLRKELGEAGLDCGASTIQWHLGRSGLAPLPSVATVHRVLVRRGLVERDPSKRPRPAVTRFEAPAPNEWWQIDAMECELAGGQVAKVFSVLDDHSRVALACRAAAEATGEEAWAAFSQAAGEWGLPAGVLSDNGLCFSGKLRGFEVLFEARLRDAGVRPFTGRPYHPQTTGKVERFQQTLRKRLDSLPPAETIEALQGRLDGFRPVYNWERPHQGIGRATPGSRWHATPASGPAPGPLAHPEWPSRTHRAAVGPDGSVRAGRFKIHIGVEWAGRGAVVVMDRHRANVLVDGRLVRHLELDHARSYQPSGRARGGPRRPRLGS